jgi:hypothetical protein
MSSGLEGRMMNINTSLVVCLHSSKMCIGSRACPTGWNFLVRKILQPDLSGSGISYLAKILLTMDGAEMPRGKLMK